MLSPISTYDICRLNARTIRGLTSLDFGCRFGGIVLIGVVRTQRQPRSHSRGTIPDYTSTTSHSVVLDYVHFLVELSGGSENLL
jgi:hypothetical protein